MAGASHGLGVGISSVREPRALLHQSRESIVKSGAILIQVVRPHLVHNDQDDELRTSDMTGLRCSQRRGRDASTYQHRGNKNRGKK